MINNVDKDFKFLFDDYYRQSIKNGRVEKTAPQDYVFDWSLAVAILATVLWGLIRLG